MLAGLAEAIALSHEQRDDLRTAVTEACNNVVQHAYRDGEGPLDMEVRVVHDAVEVVVRDEGVGMSPTWEHEVGELEIGLPVMLTLAERVQVRHAPGGGTEVQMRFLAPGLEALDGGGGSHQGPPQIALPQLRASMRVAFASTELAGAILPRLAAAVAARAHFSAERVCDVQILSDALAPAVALANGPSLEVALGGALRRLDVQVGPFPPGGVQRLLRAWAPAIDRLVDERSVTAIGPSEILLLQMCDRP